MYIYTKFTWISVLLRYSNISWFISNFKQIFATEEIGTKNWKGVWQRFSDFKFEEYKAEIKVHSWNPCVVRWPNAMISAAFQLLPSTKSKWMRTERMNSVWLICGSNYMWCEVMTVLGCDSRLLVFSLLTCCSCLSPGRKLHFVYSLSWIIPETWLGRQP